MTQPNRGPRRALLVALAAALLAGCVGELSAPQPMEPGAVLAHETGDGDGSSSDKKHEPMGFAACVNGLAGPFPCSNVDLMSFLPTNELCAGGSGGDLWGWTDKRDGREYAIQSHGSSTSFVDVTDPSSPVLLGCLPAPLEGTSPNVLWRDVEVYGDHAYVTGDAPSTSTNKHGVQIYDLRQLRDIPRPVLAPHLLTETARYGDSRIHTITVNPQTGIAYLAASSRCGRTLELIDLSAPASPRFVGCLRMFHPITGAAVTSHEAHCVVYSGPDGRFHGREICFFSNESALHVVDVTDKTIDADGFMTNATVLQRIVYPGLQYVHQGWLAHDQRYFVLGDELDEMDNAPPVQKTKTYLFDAASLTDIVTLPAYEHATGCIDHQIHVKGPIVFQANYSCGLRVFDGRRIGQSQLVEIAFFDTDPTSDDAPVFSGAWGSYPYFKSGNVIVSDIEQGLFVLRPKV